MPRRLFLAWWLASLPIAGCGGGGGGGSGHTATLPAEAGLCGWVTATGDYHEIAAEPSAGDLYLPTTGVEQGRRGFLSFDISSIPPTATVISATLRFRAEWGDPASLTGFGDLLLDQVVYGDSLDAGAYDRAFPVNQGFAVVEPTPSGTDTEIDATLPVQSDLASMRTRSQFRMRFEVETVNDQVSEGVFLYLFGGFPPVLIVRWQ